MPDREWHLPYEDIPDGRLEIDVVGQIADGVTYRSGDVDVDGVPYPIVVFDFTVGAEPLCPPIMFVGNPSVMRNLSRGVQAAVTAAIKAAGG